MNMGRNFCVLFATKNHYSMFENYIYKYSIADFNEAIKLDDKNPIIYSNRGLVNRKLERYELAIKDYSNEIKYSQVDKGISSNVKAFNNRAYCLAKLSMY